MAGGGDACGAVRRAPRRTERGGEGETDGWARRGIFFPLGCDMLGESDGANAGGKETRQVDTTATSGQRRYYPSGTPPRRHTFGDDDDEMGIGSGRVGVVLRARSLAAGARSPSLISPAAIRQPVAISSSCPELPRVRGVSRQFLHNSEHPHEPHPSSAQLVLAQF